jgi:hypothetical protein
MVSQQDPFLSGHLSRKSMNEATPSLALVDRSPNRNEPIASLDQLPANKAKGAAQKPANQFPSSDVLNNKTPTTIAGS